MYIVEDDTPEGSEPARPNAHKGKSGKKGSKGVKGSKGKSGVKGSKGKSGKKGPKGGHPESNPAAALGVGTEAPTVNATTRHGAATSRTPARVTVPEQLRRLLGWMVRRIGGVQRAGVAHRMQRVLGLLLRVNQRCGGRW